MLLLYPFVNCRIIVSIRRQYIIAFVILLAAGMLQAGCSMLDDSDEIRLRQGLPIFSYAYSYTINGEKIVDEIWSEADSYGMMTQYWPLINLYVFRPFFGGLTFHNEGNVEGMDITPENLSFCLLLNSVPPHEVSFVIRGPGDGPFVEGVDYSSENNNIVFGPDEMTGWHWSLSKKHDASTKLGVKILSSSIKFGYTKTDKELIEEVLDFYFEFEELVTSVPDGSIYDDYSIGDTIKVTNGHFIQNLYFSKKDNLDRVHNIDLDGVDTPYVDVKKIIIPK